MEHYFQQKLELEDMRRMMLIQGTRKSHPQISLLEKKISSTQEQIDRIVKEYEEKPEETATLDPEELARKEALERVVHIRNRESQLSKLYKDLQTETLGLGRKALQIERLKSQVAMKRQRLKETRFRIEQLNVESGVSGRVNIISRGDQPLKPSKDKRKQLAIAGGVGGAFSGLGLVAMLGFMDRRLRYISDAEHSVGELPILGILPRLPEDISRSEQAQLAAGCVHHIRTMLQINLKRDNRAAISVTGPAQGSGKTSLAMALGLSFVEAGMRTLLIDADLAGAGLTRRANVIVRRRLGHILRESGLVSDEQLDAALAKAGNGQGRLGEILIGHGAIDSEGIADALRRQDESQLGLVDAIEGMALEHCIAQTDYPDLFVLPIGRACHRDASRFSPARLSQLLEQAKSEFDMVIVDTGPVLGSVEASAIAASVDSVVVTAARGDSRSGIEKAVDQLRRVEASIAGLVFNRATESDVEHSSFSSARSVATDADWKAGQDTQAQEFGGKHRFGPLPHAVVHRPSDSNS
jgi:Mrp family chromosome partitioning ATPase